QPRVDIYDEAEVDQSLLEEIEDHWAEPIAQDLQVTEELPALEAGEVAYEPIAPAEPVRADTPNLIETFYVPTGGIDETIDEPEPALNGYERHAAEIPTGPSFVERLQEAAGLIADAPEPAAPQPESVAPVAVEPAPVAVEPEPVVPVLEPQPEPIAPFALEPETFVAPEPEPIVIPQPE